MINEILSKLAALFQRENISATIDSPFLLLPGGHKLKVKLSEETLNLSKPSIHLEISFISGSGEELKENFIGIGSDIQQATANALIYFEQVFFYLILSTFFGRNSQWVTEETWEMDGKEFIVRIGRPVMRGEDEVLSQISFSFFNSLEEELKSMTWQKDLNWISIFFASKNACLLNNADWPKGEKILQNSPHPQTEKYYSLRLLMTLVKK